MSLTATSFKHPSIKAQIMAESHKALDAARLFGTGQGRIDTRKGSVYLVAAQGRIQATYYSKGGKPTAQDVTAAIARSL